MVVVVKQETTAAGPALSARLSSFHPVVESLEVDGGGGSDPAGMSTTGEVIDIMRTPGLLWSPSSMILYHGWMLQWGTDFRIYCSMYNPPTPNGSDYRTDKCCSITTEVDPSYCISGGTILEHVA